LVIYTGEGSLNPEPTIISASQVREARKKRARAKQANVSVSPGNKLAPLGPTLHFAELDGDVAVVCECGYVFCSARHNWKEYASAAEVPAERLGRLIVLHYDLVAHEYSCPACGKLQSVDIGLRGDPPLFDVEIDVEHLRR
jgi:acetone carboxylase gamma subunit